MAASTSSSFADPRPGDPPAPPAAVRQHDFIALGIVVASIILFIGTGSAVLPPLVRMLTGNGPGPDLMLSNALVLNVALTLFSWRRYADVTRALSERATAEREAQRMAQTDPLTGVLNRYAVAEHIDALIQSSAADGNCVGIVMFDLDNFKSINDLHGHAAGDAVLCETASRIAMELPDDAVLARIGADEFVCAVAFDPARSDAIVELANRAMRSITEPVCWNSTGIDLAVSIGLARADTAGDGSAQILMHQADIAVVQSKQSAPHAYCWFDPEMESELRLRDELESGIRRGIALGEFVPYYEQQIELASGRLVGFEMLARWESAKLGIVSPDVFIPIAERIGMIGELSDALIRQALIDARHWHPSLTLAVNISPVQLRDPWFAQKLLKLLVEANFAPSRLEIEITESSLLENMSLVKALIISLKNQGVQISLDDFGTGYSSLSQLRSLPFDRIKIDRSFITTLPDSSESATIVRSIIAMGDGLGLPVTAEGVETAKVRDALAAFTGLRVQGFLYGLPAPGNWVSEELARQDLLALPAGPADDDTDHPLEPSPRANRG